MTIDVYVNASGNGPKLYSSINGTFGTYTKWPQISYVGQGLIKLCCSGSCLYNFGKSDGAPQYLMPLPTTTESFPTFFGYLGKFIIDSDIVTDKISFAIVNAFVNHDDNATTGLSQAQVTQCAASGNLTVQINNMSSCYPTYGPVQTADDIQGAGAWAQSELLCTYGGLMNGAGEAVSTVTITLPTTEFEPSCTADTVQDAIHEIKAISSSFKGVTNIDTLNAMDFVKATVDMRYSVQACASLLDNMVTWGVDTISLDSSYGCSYEYNTSEWKADPCCNWFDTKCCVPKSVTMNLTSIESVSRANVSAYCPGKAPQVFGTIYAAVGDQNSGDEAVTADIWDQYETYRTPLSDCLYGLWGLNCEKDIDCYSRDCDTDSNQCKVPTNVSETFFRCAYINFDTKIFNAIRKELDVSMGSMDEETLIIAMKNAMEQEYSTQDCVGRSAWEYRARLDWQQDESGNYNQVITPANSTGCVSEKQCNWQWGYDQQQCENSTGKSEYFCGECNEGFCWDVSRFPYCEVGNSWSGSLDQNTCETTIGGTWTSNDWGWYYCVHSNASMADSLDLCFDPTVCPGTGSPDTWIKESVCYTYIFHHDMYVLNYTIITFCNFCVFYFSI